jgi:hypothetical protein
MTSHAESEDETQHAGERLPPTEPSLDLEPFIDRVLAQMLGLSAASRTSLRAALLRKGHPEGPLRRAIRQAARDASQG